MKILLNGQIEEIADHSTLSTVLEMFNLQNQAIAVAINREVIPRSQIDETKVAEGDQVEVVRAVGGG